MVQHGGTLKTSALKRSQTTRHPIVGVQPQKMSRKGKATETIDLWLTKVLIGTEGDQSVLEGGNRDCCGVPTAMPV
jgi:hypothetical protein